MKHKYIQPQRFKTALPKASAVTVVEEYINSNIGDFKNGEEIIVEYVKEWAESGETMSLQLSVPAIVIINDGQSTVRPTMADDDTLKIVEGDEEPEDKNALWLTDLTSGDTSGETSDLREEIKVLKSAIKTLQALVGKHEYALNNTLAGGDIIVNAEKFDLENKYPKEKPEDAEDPVPWAEEDFVVTRFETYVGDSDLINFTGDDASLYKNQKYPLKFKFYNILEERVPDDKVSVLINIYQGEKTKTIENGVLFWEYSGLTDVYIEATSLTDLSSVTNKYFVNFQTGEKPSYELYDEPNVHHQLIKHADSTEIIEQNFNYLLVGEFCWSISENALYLKEKASNGTIQLFKINGQGSITPTGDTETITYIVDNDGEFSAASTKDSIKIVDGILTLVGEIDENGILILNNQTIHS